MPQPKVAAVGGRYEGCAHGATARGFWRSGRFSTAKCEACRAEKEQQPAGRFGDGTCADDHRPAVSVPCGRKDFRGVVLYAHLNPAIGGICVGASSVVFLDDCCECQIDGFVIGNVYTVIGSNC